MCFLLLATAPPASAAFATGAAAPLLPRPGVRAASAERHHGRRDDEAHEEKLNGRRRCRVRTVVGVDDEQKRRSLSMAPAGRGEPQVK
jgi:hypothetical protein